ncbi:MAG: methyltransferase type 11, partial [Bacteroidetes bacterium]
MQYDPIKASLGRFFNRSIFFRKVFYKLLDLLLLRAWHVHSEL